jgi:transcriptional regulator with XRE-family HTH domain
LPHFQQKDLAISPIIGQRIRRFRHDLGWTLEVLANKIKVCDGTLSKLELGQMQVTESYAHRLAQAFICPSVTFIDINHAGQPLQSTLKIALGRWQHLKTPQDIAQMVVDRVNGQPWCISHLEKH